VTAAVQLRSYKLIFRAALLHLKISQTALGSAVGMSQSRISLIVNGKYDPAKLDELLSIADGLTMPDPVRRQLRLPLLDGATGDARDDDNRAARPAAYDLPLEQLLGLYDPDNRLPTVDGQIHHSRTSMGPQSNQPVTPTLPASNDSQSPIDVPIQDIDSVIAGTASAGRPTADSIPSCETPLPREGDDVQRRRLLQGLALAGLASRFELAAAGELAAEVYRWHGADAGPDALALDELDDEVNQHAAALTFSPHADLAPRVYETWRTAEAWLRSRVTLRTRRRLTLAAAGSAYLLGRLAFNLGDAATARRFVALAARHADDADDPVLSASAVEIRSTLAFYAGAYEQAAREAAEGALRWPHPYIVARLAAYEARARAALGDVPGTREALDRMRRTAVDMPVRPGASPFGPDLAESFLGGVLARAGLGDEAEPVARGVVDRAHGLRLGYEDTGHALLSLAAALAAKSQPDPEQAAHVASLAVTSLQSCPTSSVAVKANEVAATLSGWTRSVPAVRELRDKLQAITAQALPAGTS
jgi:transcriptional regulator with XRE-family HTH domain